MQLNNKNDYDVSGLVVLLCLVVHAGNCVTLTPKSLGSSVAKPKVLLLSVGGFQDYYIKRGWCPTLARFIIEGTRAKYIKTSINVASVVNHYSIVTGLFPESHGIVSDDIMVAKNNIQPVWKELEEQRKEKFGICHWPGIDHSMLPDLNCKNTKTSFMKDVNRVVDWFVSKDITLALLYMDAIKEAALKWGPYSNETLGEVIIFDFLLKHLLQRLLDNDLKINIIITSDHGVTDLDWDNLIDLDKCIDYQTYTLAHSQGTLLVYPKQGQTVDAVYKNLKKCPQLKVYLKEKLPSRYHYSHNQKIPPIIVFVPLGAIVRSSHVVHKNIDGVLNGDLGSKLEVGGENYDPDYAKMRSVFYANGPSFRQNFFLPPMNNTDIYVLVCYLLDIQPKPNNGSFGLVKSMLTNETWSLNADMNTNMIKLDINLTYAVIHQQLFYLLVVCIATLVIICYLACFSHACKNIPGFPRSRSGFLGIKLVLGKLSHIFIKSQEIQTPQLEKLQ